jgi:hypothetical protein
VDEMSEEEKVDAFENRMKEITKKQPLMVSRQRVPELFPGLNPKTLANLESRGIGPPSFKRGRTRFYWVSDLIKFITISKNDKGEN